MSILETEFPPDPDEVMAFGDHWVGGDLYEIHTEMLVAEYRKDGGDIIQDVNVYSTPHPARFYRIQLVDTGFEIKTGSNMCEDAARIAYHLSTGMLEFPCLDVSSRSLVERLVAAIAKHRDTFPDEALEGERELWDTIKDYE
jgi:hypothetical protein